MKVRENIYTRARALLRWVGSEVPASGWSVGDGGKGQAAQELRAWDVHHLLGFNENWPGLYTLWPQGQHVASEPPL